MDKQTAEIRKLPQFGPNRTMVLVDGKPLMVKLSARKSSTRPGALKAVFYAEAPGGKGAVSSEFRIECN
jgi:hypothetical protein